MAAAKRVVIDLTDDGDDNAGSGGAVAAAAEDEDCLALASRGLSACAFFVLSRQPYAYLQTRFKAFDVCSELCFISQPGSWECGYVNTQMLLTAMMATKRFKLGTSVPTIASVQALIDAAHAAGFDPEGKQHFDQVAGGALRGKRVWIGPTEVASLFRMLGIAARCIDFKGPSSAVNVAKFCQTYFRHGLDAALEQFSPATAAARPRLSARPLPLYFQYEGHSWTLVGARDAIVLAFDPLRHGLMRERDFGVLAQRNVASELHGHRELQILVVGPAAGEPDVFSAEAAAAVVGSPVSKHIEGILIASP